nr:site-specific integrase [Streptomyces sp. SID4950]
MPSGQVRYRFVIDVGVHPNGKRRQLTVTKKDEDEARVAYGRILSQKAAGTLVLPTRITVAQWIEEWLKQKERDVETTTIRTYGHALIHMVDILGPIKLQELTQEQVRDCIDMIVASGRRAGGSKGSRLAVSTVEGILGKFRECLAAAVVQRLRVTNPAEGVRVSLADKKLDRRERPRVKPWSVQEVQKFVAKIPRDRLHAPLLFSLMGLRPAEVVGLRWEYLDLKNATLEIAVTRTMIGNVIVLEKDAKTEAGERLLPLPLPVLEALKKFKARQAQEKLAAGEAYVDSGWVVVNEFGVARNTRHLREHAYRLMREFELRRVRLYDARHSCLSYLANNGVPDHILARWAGHANADFTKRKYVHVEVEDMREAAETWRGLHGGQ